MADKSRFVQIAATGNDLYALDQNGDVWVYRFKTSAGEKEQWIKLKTDRRD